MRRLSFVLIKLNSVKFLNYYINRLISVKFSFMVLADLKYHGVPKNRDFLKDIHAHRNQVVRFYTKCFNIEYPNFGKLDLII